MKNRINKITMQEIKLKTTKSIRESQATFENNKYDSDNNQKSKSQRISASYYSSSELKRSNSNNNISLAEIDNSNKSNLNLNKNDTNNNNNFDNNNNNKNHKLIHPKKTLNKETLNLKLSFNHNNNNNTTLTFIDLDADCEKILLNAASQNPKTTNLTKLTKSLKKNNQKTNENKIHNQLENLKHEIPARLDKLPYTNFHTLIICALGISWVLDGYEVSLLSVLSGVLETSFRVSDREIGLAGSLYLLGCVVGSLFFGFLASLFGRRTLFNVTLFVYGTSIVLTSLAFDIKMFFVCRFFTGIAVGGEYSSIFAAIDELIPPGIRGRADLIIDGTWHFGSFLASIISFFVLNFNKESKEYESFLMRVLFSLGAIFVLPIIYMRRFIPESPRWLVYQGRYKEALRVLESIEAKCGKSADDDAARLLGLSEKHRIEEDLNAQVETEIEENNGFNDNYNADANNNNYEENNHKYNNNNENNSYINNNYNKNNINNINNKSDNSIYRCDEEHSKFLPLEKSTSQNLKSPLLNSNSETNTPSPSPSSIQSVSQKSFKQIFLFLFKTHKTRFFYSLILMASQAFFYNGIFYTYTLILQNFYAIEKQKVGLYLIPLSAASFCGPLLLGKFFDSWSRRKMIALTFILSGVLLTIAAANFLFEFFGFFVQQIFLVLTFLVASPAASSAHLTVSEIFPIEIRSQAMAIFFSMGLGVGGVISPFFFGMLVANKDKKEIFFSYLLAAGVMVLAGIFGYFFGVDAENKSLEQIALLDNQVERSSIDCD